jgi:hypothetical protein
MRKEAGETFEDSRQAEVEQRDPQSIADLIDKLNQDLAETQKLSSEPR